MSTRTVALALLIALGNPLLSGKAIASGLPPLVATESGPATQRRLAQLIVPPECLQSLTDSIETYRIEEVSFPSGDITLKGQLYLPSGSEKHPAVVLMHGGGNDYDMLMSSPRYHARRLAHCGFAALIYDKRGTGESGGVFHESTRDDFINDAGHAAVYLSHDERIDPTRIAVHGGSEGGQLAPLVSIRFPVVSAVISVSGPFVSAAEQANHNIDYSLRSRGYPDSLVDFVMPLWRRHHAAWASRDPAEMQAVAERIEELRKTVDTFALPNTEQEIMTDTNLFFLRPGFNSMGEDYTAELANLRVPLLVLYGVLDPIVDVPLSVANLREQLAIGGHDESDIFVFDSVGHSFVNPRTGERTPTVNIILNWLDETFQRP